MKKTNRKKTIKLVPVTSEDIILSMYRLFDKRLNSKQTGRVVRFFDKPDKNSAINQCVYVTYSCPSGTAVFESDGFTLTDLYKQASALSMLKLAWVVEETP